MMLKYLESFSESFLLAVLLWPLMALLLTLPVLLIQYIRFHRLPKVRVGVIYLFILYILALLAFTLYPLPDDPSKYCATHSFIPQLIPGQFIFDIAKDGMRAVLGIVFNLAFFLPLGLFLRNLFGFKLWHTLAIAFLVSLFIETAQLTGAFNFYPCSYRLFDVDDLLFNTIGALIGFAAATFLPNLSKPAKVTEVDVNPKLLHRLVAFAADFLMYSLLALIILVILRTLGIESELGEWIVRGAVLVTLQFIVPSVWKGQTVFGRLTGISLDDQKRGKVHRVLFYLTRLALIAAVLYLPELASVVVVLATWVYWLVSHKLPYTVVDLFFKHE
jgi:glycopeptide antibiotics resistance protein